MCGIVGLFTKKTNGFAYTDLQRFQALLVTDSQRGEDSTGAFVVKNDGSAKSIKIASHPFHLFACDAWGKFRSEAIASGKILVGHNRKATQGAISSNNAHPFSEGKIVLVHNGTLRNHKKFSADTAVDSHAIAKAFNEGSHEEILSQIDGAFTFVWYNLETEKLYMIRNADRPLWMVDAGESMGFGSEAWMVEGQFKHDNTAIKSVWSLPEGELHEFSLTGELVTKKIELYKPNYPVNAPFAHGYRQQVPYGGRLYDDDNDDVIWQKRLENAANITQITRQFLTTSAPDLTQPYNKSDTIQVHITCIEPEYNHISKKTGYKAKGKVIEVNKPNWDFAGWLPEDYTQAQALLYLKDPVAATVLSVHTSNVCGPSLFVEDFYLDDKIKVFTDKEVGEWTWTQIVDNVQCFKCKTRFVYEDSKFTSVNINNKNQCRVHCSTCVSNELPNGEIRNEFIKNRIAAVQNRKPVSETSLVIVEPKTERESTPTIH